MHFRNSSALSIIDCLDVRAVSLSPVTPSGPRVYVPVFLADGSLGKLQITHNLIAPTDESPVWFAFKLDVATDAGSGAIAIVLSSIDDSYRIVHSDFALEDCTDPDNQLLPDLSTADLSLLRDSIDKLLTGELC